MAERGRTVALAERFGKNLRRVRNREDLSQEQLGRLASLHRTEIGLLEKGERVCRIDTLIRLAGAMAVPPGELLDGIHWVPGPEPKGHSRSAQVRSQRHQDQSRKRQASRKPEPSQSDSARQPRAREVSQLRVSQ
jgi:transcriptional regulator with XRE-family HTH domain